jgi:hypothetical protein
MVVVRIWEASITAPRALKARLKRAYSSGATALWDDIKAEVPGTLARGVQNTAVECLKHPVPAMRATVIDWARATPNETAVAATISEMASASVATSSTPRVRFFDNTFSEMGDAKPTFPVSSVMTRFVLRESLCCVVRRITLLRCSQCRAGLGRTR